ncbi:MAG: MarC family protein [Candidatus Omnitrophica bacterium]|nr:MarC family protein [Candidatus Omnitrophota bacterium]
MENLKTFVLAFIPIFVAVDAIGVLPIFISLTEHLKRPNKLRVISNSMITAAVVAFIFIVVGKSIFRFLGITVYDFMVAGGALLFIISINDILRAEKTRHLPEHTIGAVPLGMPLIVGPAVLTTSLMMLDTYGITPTLLSVTANIVIAGVIFASSDIIIRIVGKSGTKAFSKVASLFLAAIAVMMVRKGIVHIYLDILK